MMYRFMLSAPILLYQLLFSLKGICLLLNFYFTLLVYLKKLIAHSKIVKNLNNTIYPFLYF